MRGVGGFAVDVEGTHWSSSLHGSALCTGGLGCKCWGLGIPGCACGRLGWLVVVGRVRLGGAAFRGVVNGRVDTRLVLGRLDIWGIVFRLCATGGFDAGRATSRRHDTWRIDTWRIYTWRIETWRLNTRRHYPRRIHDRRNNRIVTRERLRPSTRRNNPGTTKRTVTKAEMST